MEILCRLQHSRRKQQLIGQHLCGYVRVRVQKHLFVVREGTGLGPGLNSNHNAPHSLCALFTSCIEKKENIEQ